MLSLSVKAKGNTVHIVGPLQYKGRNLISINIRAKGNTVCIVGPVQG